MDDPACYAGTTVLRNKAGLKDQADLDQFEAAMVELRLKEPLPQGDLGEAHYRAIHRHMFGDVYAWAGKDRSIRIHKPGSTFCYPERIGPELTRLFRTLAAANHLADLPRDEFVRRAAEFVSNLNAIHPYREGNGRGLRVYLALLAESAGHSIDLSRIRAEPYLRAMIAAFHGDEGPLAVQIGAWITT